MNSPVRGFAAVGGTPVFFDHGKDAYVFSVEGIRYIDYVCSWGAMITGHANPSIVAAIQQQAAKGVGFGAPHVLEVQLAHTICQRIAAIEQIRMVNSGTEATMSAVRLARGFSGKDKIIKCSGCYHGHSDCMLVAAGSGLLTLGKPNSAGVPKNAVADTILCQYNDIASIEEAFTNYAGNIGAVILEPIAGNMNMIAADTNFIVRLRALCDIHGSVLIFDEVMSGFRVAAGGAAQRIQTACGVVPDMVCFGKIIGGGLPVGAFGGKREIMQHLAPVGDVYQAGTLSGNPLAMAAGLQALQQLDNSSYKQLDAAANTLCQGIVAAAATAGIPMCYQAIGGMFGLFFCEALPQTFAAVNDSSIPSFVKFFQGMLAQGIYFAPSPFEAGFISLSHQQADIAMTIDAAQHVFNTW